MSVNDELENAGGSGLDWDYKYPDLIINWTPENFLMVLKMTILYYEFFRPIFLHYERTKKERGKNRRPTKRTKQGGPKRVRPTADDTRTTGSPSRGLKAKGKPLPRKRGNNINPKTKA